jgi:SpoVK/Ycf46/Vps4 family AAA+-type ATPase
MAPMRERLCITDVLADYEARKKALEGYPDLTIRMGHFETAMEKIMPSVSQNTVKQYLQWMEEFGSK